MTTADQELDILLRDSDRLYNRIVGAIGVIGSAQMTLRECKALRVRVEALPMEIENRRFWDCARVRNNLRYVRDECQQSDHYIAHDLLWLPDNTGNKDIR